MQQRKKREALQEMNRLFSGRNAVKKICVWVPLCEDVASKDVEIEGLIRIERENKSDYEFVLQVLDACQVADIVVFGISSITDVDKLGMTVLSCLRAQGMPSSVAFAHNFDKVIPKKQNDVKRSLLAFMVQELGTDNGVRLFTESQMMTRHIQNLIPSRIHWREMRPYMLADQINYVPETQTLLVEGTNRGQGFNVNHLVHLKTLGDFQLDRIEIVPRHDGEMEHFLAPNEEQEKLEHQLEPDPMDGEQTWPTEEEVASGEARMEAMLREEAAEAKRKVPRGTSSYQAAWIADEFDGEEEVEYEEEMDHGVVDEEMEEEAASDANNSAFSEVDMDERQTHNDSDDDSITPEEELRQLEEWRELKRQEQEEMEFPDEVDTPIDMAARVRFQKYRGLKSFKTSSWDPYENLPLDYARIYQFENFDRMRRQLLNDLEENEDVSLCAQVAQRVRLHIRAVPAIVEDLIKVNPVVSVFGLFPHEQRMSVVNMTCQRPLSPRVTDDEDLEEDQPIIKSKDAMMIQCGFRRYLNRPIYSQYSLGKQAGRLFKYETFLFPGATCMATVFGPVQYPPAPVLYFTPPDTETGDFRLIATGSLHSVDPTRLVIKRRVLTGKPARIHKSSHNHTAVIKFMFFNDKDVDYFRPIELRTKMGRRGHIIDSIGTHGTMKCRFDRGLKSMDTVCLNLYKRVYPKWPQDGGYSSLFGQQAAQEELERIVAQRETIVDEMDE